MSDLSRALLIGGIIGIGLSPIILAFAWLPMRRRAASDEITQKERMAVLRNVAIGVGVVVLIATAGFYWLSKTADEGDGGMGGMAGGMSGGMPAGGMPGGFTSQTAMPSVPESLAGVPLVESLTGDDALAQVDSMHSSDFPVSGAVVGFYRDKDHESTVWVAVTPAEQMAPAMSADMAEAIASGDTPFGEPESVGDGAWRVEGLGQVHYFFPAGASVWWLSVDEPLVERSLAQVRAAAQSESTAGG